MFDEVFILAYDQIRPAQIIGVMVDEDDETQIFEYQVKSDIILENNIYCEGFIFETPEGVANYLLEDFKNNY